MINNEKLTRWEGLSLAFNEDSTCSFVTPMISLPSSILLLCFPQSCFSFQLLHRANTKLSKWKGYNVPFQEKNKNAIFAFWGCGFNFFKVQNSFYAYEKQEKNGSGPPAIDFVLQLPAADRTTSFRMTVDDVKDCRTTRFFFFFLLLAIV